MNTPVNPSLVKELLRNCDADRFAAVLAWSSGAYLRETGWFQSFKAKLPLDKEGQPLPWFTYPSISFLRPRINKSMKVFEYGAGCSTLWWAERVAQVISCESDKQWYDRLLKFLPPNVRLSQVDLIYGGEYCKAILNHQNEFDIVVIDGRDRVNCAKNCLAALKPEGVIVWDNSDRKQYQEGYDCLQSHGFRRIDFEGVGPELTAPWWTSVFYRSSNVLGI